MKPYRNKRAWQTIEPGPNIQLAKRLHSLFKTLATVAFVFGAIWLFELALRDLERDYSGNLIEVRGDE